MRLGIACAAQRSSASERWLAQALGHVASLLLTCDACLRSCLQLSYKDCKRAEDTEGDGTDREASMEFAGIDASNARWNCDQKMH